MKRSHFVLALSPTLLAFIVLAGSCSSANPTGAAKKQISTFDPNANDGGGGGSSGTSGTDGGIVDSAAPDVDIEMFREIKNPPQALQILITGYDTEIQEGEVGKASGTTPPVKAFSADIVEDAKAGKARIRQLAANKHLTPATSLLNDRMKFESQASVSNLRNMWTNMFNDAYVNRRIDAASNMLRLIDDDLAPVLTDDDLKSALSTTRDETEKRLARAQAVRDGLLNGPASSDGMFPAPDDPEPEPQAQPARDGGAAAAAPARAPAAPAALR